MAFPPWVRVIIKNQSKWVQSSSLGPKPMTVTRVLQDDDELPDDDGIHDGGDSDDPPSASSPWIIAIIDDDDGVHGATAFALSGFTFHGRILRFIHARSASEGKSLFDAHPDIALALVDVVMETPDAGLRLVNWVRTEHRNPKTRIILRTGQPGYAPADEVVRSYDINDYREKADLDAARLKTSVIAALRAYEQIDLLAKHKEGLTRLIDALGQMFGRTAVDTLAEGVIEQLAAVLRICGDGIACAEMANGVEPVVLAATGLLRADKGKPLHLVSDRHVAQILRSCLAARRTIVDRRGLCLYVETPGRKRVAVFAATPVGIPETDAHLLEILGRNLSLAFDNADLFERTQRESRTDPVTGLPNLLEYRRIVNRALESNRPIVVLSLMILRYEMIVDAITLDRARTILRTFAAQMVEQVEGLLVIARGYNEGTYVVAAQDTTGADLFEDLKRVTATPIACMDVRIPIRVAGGFAAAPADGLDAMTLLRHAQVALSALTNANSGPQSAVQGFHPTLLEAATGRLNYVTALQDAFTSDRIAVHFQPIVEAASGRTLAAEALLRVRTETGGFYSTAAIIDAAEHSGMIAEIGLWTITEALRHQGRWRNAGRIGSVSINVSPTQMRYLDLRSILTHLFVETGADPESVIIEITEQSLLDPDETAIFGFLRWFRSIGGRVAIDDFGAGYSSMRYIHRLPVDIMKIDRDFVAAVSEACPDDRRRRVDIVDAMIRVGRSLDLVVVAEGIETAAQKDEMVRLGVHAVQGYFFARPMPPEDYEAHWLLPTAP